MPQSYARIILHTTFSTKYRTPYLHPDIEKELFPLMTSFFRERGCTVLRINAVPDHIHIVHSLPRTKALAEVMEKVKKLSSKWLKTKGERFRCFAWQDGYASHSVDYRKLEGIFNYVDNQKTHHGFGNTRLTFEIEYRRILQAFDLEYDERFLFPTHPAAPSPKGSLS